MKMLGLPDHLYYGKSDNENVLKNSIRELMIVYDDAGQKVAES